MEGEILKAIRRLEKDVAEIKRILSKGRKGHDSIVSRIISLANNTKADVAVVAVMEEFSISNPYALKLMKQAAQREEAIVFIPGNPRNPSRLAKFDKSDKARFVPLSILKEMKGCVGATKLVGAVMKQFSLSQDEMHGVVSDIVNYTNGAIGLTGSGRFTEKRLKNWRYK